MLSDRAKDALDGIRINIRAIRTFIECTTVEAFASDLLRLYAVTRALEIISEASRRLPQALRDRYPEVPWYAIRDAGNVYRHAYSRVSAEAIWDTATKQLDALWSVVVRELGPGDDDIDAASDRGGEDRKS